MIFCFTERFDCLSASKYDIYTDDEIVEMVKDFYAKKGSINTKDFTLSNNLPTNKNIRKRFGSLDKLYEKCNIPIEKRYFSVYKNADDDTLLKKLKWYVENIGFPTNRALMNNGDMPSYTLYYKKFGSLRNALSMIGYNIPDDNKKNFDRIEYTDQELLNYFKNEVDTHLQNGNIYLMTLDELRKNKNLQGQSVYYRRFKSIENIYKLIGYDYYEFNKKARRKDMIEKYMEIYRILQRTPNSRDLEKFSRENDNYFYSMSSYEFHFGSVTGIQQACGFTPTGLTRLKGRKELIDDLIKLRELLGRNPLMNDLYNHDWLPSPDKFYKEFGSFSNAIIEAGFKPNINEYYTTNGTKCLSYYELYITEWFESNNIKYRKEVPYRSVIEHDKTHRRFDWVIEGNSNSYYIEMFGIEGNKTYLEHSVKKINDCQKAGINLISIYPKDLKKPLEKVFCFLNENKKVI